MAAGTAFDWLRMEEYAAYFSSAIHDIRSLIPPPNLFFDGSIDEPAFWRVPLTQAEIETLRTNGPLGIQDEHLMAHWPVDEGSGEQAASYAGNLITGLSELGEGPIGLFDSPGLFCPVWVCSAVPATDTTGRWLLLAFALGVYSLRGWRRSLRV